MAWPSEYAAAVRICEAPASFFSGMSKHWKRLLDRGPKIGQPEDQSRGVVNSHGPDQIRPSDVERLARSTPPTSSANPHCPTRPDTKTATPKHSVFGFMTPPPCDFDLTSSVLPNRRLDDSRHGAIVARVPHDRTLKPRRGAVAAPYPRRPDICIGRQHRFVPEHPTLPLVDPHRVRSMRSMLSLFGEGPCSVPNALRHGLEGL